MFASDTDSATAQLAVIERGVRRGGLNDLLLGSFGAVVGVGCLAFLAHEAILLQAPPLGLVSLLALAAGIGGVVGAKRNLSGATVARLKRPNESSVYRAVAGGSPGLREVGGVVGARHVVRLRLEDGSAHELPVSPNEVQPLVRFIQLRLPECGPFR